VIVNYPEGSMELSKKAIEEFKEIYYKQFGQHISDEKAQELGKNVISLFEIIYRFPPESNNDNNRSENVA